MSDKILKFIPKPGQVDYTHIKWAPVVNCIVRYGDKILLVQRSEKVNYGGLWDGVSGFLDDDKSLKEKVIEEIEEETGITGDKIVSMKFGSIFHKEDANLNKIYIMHPVLVEVVTDKINLNWEAQKYFWIKPDEIRNFDLLHGYEQVLESVLPGEKFQVK